MPLLDKFRVVEAAKPAAAAQAATVSPRDKLLEAIDLQIALAEAIVGNATLPTKTVKKPKVIDGVKKRVDTEIKIRPMFWHDSAGKWMFAPKYGTQSILPKGNSYEIGKKEQLVKKLKDFRAAVDAGELDETIEKIRPRRGKKK